MPGAITKIDLFCHILCKKIFKVGFMLWFYMLSLKPIYASECPQTVMVGQTALK